MLVTTTLGGSLCINVAPKSYKCCCPAVERKAGTVATECESGLRLLDYLGLYNTQDGWEYKFKTAGDWQDDPDRSMNSREIYIHENTTWGPRLYIPFSLYDGATHNVQQGFNLSKHFWNDNGTLRYDDGLHKVDQPMVEGILHPDEAWQMYWDDSKQVKKEYKCYEGEDLAARGVGRAYGDYDYGYEDESEVQEILESIYRRLDEEGSDVPDSEDDAKW